MWTSAAQQVQARLAGENLKLFVNREEVFKFHPDPRYYELRDGFAYKSGIKLKAGWNELLVKVEHDKGRFGPVVFSVRLSDTRGLPMRGLISSIHPDPPESLRRERGHEHMERWYRVQIPPGTRALRLPDTPNFHAVYLNGKPTKIAKRLEFGTLDWHHLNVICLVTSAADELSETLHFEPGESSYHLGSWTWTGLSSFSGETTYQKVFVLDRSLEGKRIELDLGQVGVTAEVWLNGQRLGERLWQPYRFDVTAFLHAGKNDLKIAVSNSDSNSRAEEDVMRYIDKTQLPGGDAAVFMGSLNLNGLLGPVQLVPYSKFEMSLP